MNLLAVDTSTSSCSVALFSGPHLVAEAIYTDGKTHSRHLMSMIDGILARCGHAPEWLDGIAITRGPGTFTGLRIGISTVKGLAVAAGIPVVGVNSLAALAYPMVMMDRLVVAMTDARRGEVYHAQFKGYQSLFNPSVAVSAPEKAAATIPEDALLVGSGAMLYRELFEQQCRFVHFADTPANSIRAASVGLLAMRAFEHRDIENTDALVPEYIRKSDAQIHMAGSC